MRIYAQKAQSVAGEYLVVQRTPSSRVWQKLAFQTNDAGVIRTNVQSYTEMRSGLCRSDKATGALVDSSAQIDLVADGAQAKKDYVIASEEASLVWLANLACIDLHQMHSRASHFDKPDYIVYDLIRQENSNFRMSLLAMQFNEHLEKFGYHPFVKTTGRKGLHLATPIEPKWDFLQAHDVAKAVAQPFIGTHATALTLEIKKERRNGEVLLDIYRGSMRSDLLPPRRESTNELVPRWSKPQPQQRRRQSRWQ